MRRMFIMSVVMLLAMACVSSLYSQSKQVREALRKIASGKTLEAQGMLAELQEAGKDDPAIMYLQAVLTEDAFRAVNIYKKITTDYPKSEWCDDAYWRLVQFYAVKGDTAKALKELDLFKSKFPASEFLSPATDLVGSALSYYRSSAKNKKPESVAKVVNSPKENIKTNEVKHKDDNKNVVETKPEKIEKKAKSYGIQVGIYSSIETAKSETEKFKVQRLRSEIVEKEVNGKKMFAVIIGNYATKESLEKNRTIVEKICNCETIIYEKK